MKVLNEDSKLDKKDEWAEVTLWKMVEVDSNIESDKCESLRGEEDNLLIDRK